MFRIQKKIILAQTTLYENHTSYRKSKFYVNKTQLQKTTFNLLQNPHTHTHFKPASSRHYSRRQLSSPTSSWRSIKYCTILRPNSHTHKADNTIYIHLRDCTGRCLIGHFVTIDQWNNPISPFSSTTDY